MAKSVFSQINTSTIKRLLSIGDIHGCFDKLYELVEHRVKLRKDDKLVLLGDYIDRGPDSKGVLDYITGLRSEGFDIIALMGNHEDMMLRARNNPMDIPGWILNGGDATLSSFEADSVGDIDTRYFGLLESLPKYHFHGNYIFVHGGFNDEIDDPFSDEQSMLWDRRFGYKSPQLKDRIVVHGHRPQRLSDLQENLQHNPSVINLDTGCVYGRSSGYGDLTALELGKNRLFYA